MVKELSYKNKEEWMTLRQGYIGGSDAGSVVGLNPYRGSYTLWAEKTGRIEAFSGNLTTEVGAYLEDLVADLFTRETGKKVRRKNRILVNDNYPFACANVDRLVVGEHAFLEIKTTNSIPVMRAIRDGGSEFPDIYYTQCVHYLAVTGLEKCYLAVLVNCRELKIYEMTRDEDEIKALMDAEREFWRYVETGEEPPVDSNEDSAKTLEALHPDDGGEISLVGAEGWIREYLSIGDRIKTLKKSQDEAANLIKQAMGGASRGEAGDYRVSWTSGSRSTFDREAFSKAHPGEDLSPFYKTSISRTFRVSERRA